MNNIFALFPTFDATQTTRFINWNEVIKMASTPDSLAKDRTPCLTPQLSGKKNKQAAIEHNQMTALIIDIDENAPSLDTLKKELAKLAGECAALIYSTSSAHRLKKGVMQGDRWRVLIPLKTAVSCDRWLDMQNALVFAFSGDEAAARIAQVAYAPNNPNNRFYKHEIIQGEPLDPDQLPPLFTKLLDRLKALEAEKHAKKHALTAKTLASRPINNSGGFSIASVNEAYDTAQALENNGYIRVGKKYISPLSQSGKAGVILFDDGRWFSHHGSDADIGLKCDGGACGDAFDLICYYDHGNDAVKTLAKLAGELDSEGQKQRQREYMKAQQQKQPTQPPMNNQEHSNPNVVQGDVINTNNKKKSFNFSDFSLKGHVMELKKQLQDEVYVLEGMALRGEITVFFAPPNSGKTLITLKLLFNAVDEKNINGDDVFYINADDSLSGGTTKAELCEQHNINMLMPNYYGFKVNDFVVYLDLMIDDKTAKGKIIILDTAKKFTQLMDKESSSQFNTKLREFTLQGGTVILLAHTNKNRNGDGKLVAGGTSDLLDDSDCAYVIDGLSDDGVTKTVIFENQKRRGNCENECIFEYTSKAKTYPELVDSVTTPTDAEKAKQELKRKTQLESDKEIIEAIEDVLNREGDTPRKELISNVMDEHALPKRKIIEVLKRYAGESRLDHKKWCLIAGYRKEKIVKIL